MVRTLIRIVLVLVGNAIGLWVASLVLDDMSVSGTAFVVAVVIFTALTVVFEPLVTRTAEDKAPALRGLSALVTTFLALLVTELVSDGLEISGVVTWVLATVIVWIVTLVAGVVLPRLFLDRSDSSAR